MARTPTSILFPYTTLFRSVQEASDFRAVTALVNQFTEALRRRPGTEVTRTQLPFDINAEKSLAGDIGAARREEVRSEEHTSELQSHSDLVCRLLLEKKKKK